MRYYYERPKGTLPVYGEIYACNHPLYDRCTLFLKNYRGLAVVQQRFDPERKHCYWGPIDYWLANDIYENDRFPDFFRENADKADIDGLYPTVSVRKLMWALRMKPLRKEVWEQGFYFYLKGS